MSDINETVNKGGVDFKKLFDDMRRRQKERIRRAGKHKCVPVKAGAMHRVTGRGDRILKRPVLCIQFYECKICGRDIEEDQFGAVAVSPFEIEWDRIGLHDYPTREYTGDTEYVPE